MFYDNTCKYDMRLKLCMLLFIVFLLNTRSLFSDACIRQVKGADCLSVFSNDDHLSLVQQTNILDRIYTVILHGTKNNENFQLSSADSTAAYQSVLTILKITAEIKRPVVIQLPSAPTLQETITDNDLHKVMHEKTNWIELLQKNKKEIELSSGALELCHVICHSQNWHAEMLESIKRQIEITDSIQITGSESALCRYRCNNRIIVFCLRCFDSSTGCIKKEFESILKKRSLFLLSWIKDYVNISCYEVNAALFVLLNNGKLKEFNEARTILAYYDKIEAENSTFYDLLGTPTKRVEDLINDWPDDDEIIELFSLNDELIALLRLNRDSVATHRHLCSFWAQKIDASLSSANEPVKQMANGLKTKDETSKPEEK